MLNSALPRLSIPATLQDTLMARLDRLAPVKDIFQVGATLGREFSYPLLHAVVGWDETALKNGLVELEHAELIFRHGEPPEATYSFKHALVQDAAYESMLRSRRQVLHRKIADTLRNEFLTVADAEPEIVAHHLTLADLTEPAIEWWEKAGQRSLRSSAYNEAIAHLEKALSLADGLPDSPSQRLVRLRIQTAYGFALFHGRGISLPETIAAFARARKLATDVEEVSARFSAYFGLWSGSLCRADLEPMQEVAEAFLVDVRNLPLSAEAGIAHHIFGVTCWFRGDYLEAQRHLEQALAIYDRQRDEELAHHFGYERGVDVMARLSLVLWPLGHVGRAARLLNTALSLAQQIGHIPTIAFIHSIACIMYGIRGKPSRAGPHAESLLVLAREHGLAVRLADGEIYTGWARRYAGDRDGEQEMREALQVLADMNYHLMEPLMRTLLAQLDARDGRIDAAITALDAELNAIEASGQRCFEAEVHRVRGELLVQRTPPDTFAARSAFRRAIEVAQSQKAKTFERRAERGLARVL